MSKNPPKPNTPPDHVKETPSSARPEHGPSHTEARERLAEATAASEELGQPTVYLTTQDARTLLATPTQGGVGREEIARAMAEALYGKGCPVNPDEYRKADAILSLLPAPKLGEGAEQELAELKAIIADPALVHINMLRGTIATPPLRSLLHLYGQDALARWDASEPAPGAPEGWREIAAQAALNAKLPDGFIWGSDAMEQFDFGKKRAAEAIRALTSSSAKPVDEEPSLDNTPYQSTAYERGEVDGIDGAVMRVREALNGKAPSGMRHGGLQALCDELVALAQSNRRLREGLEAINRIASPDGSRTFDDCIHALDLITDQARAALKDNGHG